MEQDSIRSILAENVARLMKENKLSAKDVERRSGISSRMVGYILNEERAATIDVLHALARGFRKTPAEMLTRKSPDAAGLSIVDIEHLELIAGMTEEERSDVDRYAEFIIKKRDGS